MSPRRPRPVLLVAIVLLLGLGLWGCKEDKKLKVTGMSPTVGDFGGGERVTFKGNRFRKDGTRDVDVFFGTKKAHVVRFEGDDTLIVEAPGGEVNEEVEVFLNFTPGGEITLPQKFKYVKKDIADVGDLDTSKK